MPPKKEGPDRTFIEEARRAQIIQCAADVIAESGYARATMAEIAKRARIAKSVISYHFADKNDLIQEVIRTSVETYTQFLESRMAAESTAPGKIRAYLAASADYKLESAIKTDDALHRRRRFGFSIRIFSRVHSRHHKYFSGATAPRGRENPIL